MDRFVSRRERVLKSLHKDQLEVLLVTNHHNVTYLTGFSGESSYLVLTPDKSILISDGRFVEQIAQECSGIETLIRPPSQLLQDATCQVLNQLKPPHVEFDSGHLTVGEFQKLKDLASTFDWKPGMGRVETLRMLKDAYEIEQIRQAIHIGEKAFGIFRAMLRPEDTEKELHDAMEFYIRRAGGKCSSFPTIVGVGERGALPHAPPTQKKLGESSTVLVDWGASGEFYKSDFTRILRTPIQKSFDEKRKPVDEAKLRKTYETVLRAQQKAIDKIRPGVTAQEVDAVARQVFAEAGVGSFFTHGLGHGFGFQIHEAPFMRPGNPVVLEAGMVVTVEPGLYYPGEFGVRIEDDILVTPNGTEVLTQVPKNWESILVDF